MMRVSIVVTVEYDPEADVWVGTSEDIQGLAVEGKDLESLAKNVMSAVSALIQLNGLPRRRLGWVRTCFGFAKRARDVSVDFRQHVSIPRQSVAC